MTFEYVHSCIAEMSFQAFHRSIAAHYALDPVFYGIDCHWRK
jgi:hypothetical protein